MTTSANPVMWKLKKIGVQIKLKTRWIRKTIIPRLANFLIVG